MIKVFLVEDEIVVREGIKTQIDWDVHGLEFVGEASDGELAYPKILSEKPDIIITDIKMPFMDGLELSELVKKELPDTRIIILSGHDDFKYAKQAIRLKVTDYLIKPISKKELTNVLIKISEVIRKEREEDLRRRSQDDLYNFLHKNRYMFFGDLINKGYSYRDLMVKAEQLTIEIQGSNFNMILAKMFSEEMEGEEENISLFSMEDKLLELEGKYRFIYFDRGLEGMAFLMMGETESELESNSEKLIKEMISLFVNKEKKQYFIGVGTPCCRLTEVYKSYESASKVFAYQYFYSESQILRSGDLQEKSEAKVPMKKPDNSVIRKFLLNGSLTDVQGFVENYFNEISDASINSIIFKQYLIVDFYLAVKGFVDEVGIDAQEVLESRGEVGDIAYDFTKAKSYFVELIEVIVDKRIGMTVNKYEIIIKKAKEYIGSHYNEEDISLNAVAASVNISPSHFSTIFSQTVGETFIEYLTFVRMNKAKEILATSNMKITEVGYQVGYKDSHYFSYIFKKVNGITPKEYRSRSQL